MDITPLSPSLQRTVTRRTRSGLNRFVPIVEADPASGTQLITGFRRRSSQSRKAHRKIMLSRPLALEDEKTGVEKAVGSVATVVSLVPKAIAGIVRRPLRALRTLRAHIGRK